MATGDPNFDDLDIECNDNEDFTGLEVDSEEHLLLKNQTVLVGNGRRGYVFSFLGLNQGSQSSFCHLCKATLNGWTTIRNHVAGKKHAFNLQKASHHVSKFNRFIEPENSMWELQPGEPAPPGMEEFVTEKCAIEPKLEAFKSKPLVGLEYLFELTADNTSPSYCCLLCNKHGPENNIIVHLSSPQHYMKYLHLFFPSTYSALTLVPKTAEYKKGYSVVLSRIMKKIEEKYGRLKPKQHTLIDFNKDKPRLLTEIEEEYHFRESEDDGLRNMVDWSEIKKLQFYNEDADVIVVSTSNVSQEVNTNEKNKSIFNKTGRINVEKRNLRKDRESFDDDTTTRPNASDSPILIHDTKDLQNNLPPIKKSLSSVSTISSDSVKSAGRKRYRTRSRSYSQEKGVNRYRRRSRSRSRSGDRRRWSPNRRRTSRSRSPHRRYGYRHRSRSLSRGRGNYRRDRSPMLPYPRRRRSPGSRSRSPRNRSRKSPVNNYVSRYKILRKPSPRRDSQEQSKTRQTQKMTKFIEELRVIVQDLEGKLKYYEKNPEKHPQYREEWKSFWNSRYKELQVEGKDPAKHDFKPEWITYWNKRMRELHEEKLKVEKENLKSKLGLKEENKPESPVEKMPQEEVRKDVTVDDIKNTWKALTGSDIREITKSPVSSVVEDNVAFADLEDQLRLPKTHISGRPPPGARLGFIPFDDNSSRVVSVLRLISVLESQIGSLGPKVLALLSKAIAMEKNMPGSSQEILCDEEHSVLFETVKEKLKGLLFAGVVDRNFVNTTRVTLRSIDDLIRSAPKIFKREKHSVPSIPAPVSAVPAAPVTVPGIGTVDRVAIAQQIAGALIAQGKTDVTEDELEQLINAVVGMAQASNSTGPISAADYINLQTQSISQAIGGSSQRVGGLTLQSAYEDDNKVLMDENNKDSSKFHQVRNRLNNSINSLTDNELKLLVECFRELNSSEQLKLVTFFKTLETTEPVRILELQKTVNFKTLLGSEGNKMNIPSVGRLSPSFKHDSVNSSVSDPHEMNIKTYGSETIEDDEEDDDDDYSVDDVYKAASERLRQQELTQQKQKLESMLADSASIVSELNKDPKSDFNYSTKSAYVNEVVSGTDEDRLGFNTEKPRSQYSGYQNYDNSVNYRPDPSLQQSLNNSIYNTCTQGRYDAGNGRNSTSSYNTDFMSRPHQRGFDHEYLYPQGTKLSANMDDLSRFPNIQNRPRLPPPGPGGPPYNYGSFRTNTFTRY